MVQHQSHAVYDQMRTIHPTLSRRKRNDVPVGIGRDHVGRMGRIRRDAFERASVVPRRFTCSARSPDGFVREQSLDRDVYKIGVGQIIIAFAPTKFACFGQNMKVRSAPRFHPVRRDDIVQQSVQSLTKSGRPMAAAV